MDERIKKLEPVCSKHELAEVKVLQHAVFRTITDYKDDPSAANKKNWDAANDGLSAALGRLEAKYFGDEEEEFFENITAAHRWLKDNGYKISKSKIYADEKRGLLRTQPDKRVRLADVEAYVLRGGLKSPAAPDPAKTEALAAERFAAEVAKIKEQTLSIILDREIKQGKYISKTDANAALGDLAAVADGLARSVMRANMGIYLQRAGLDAAKAGEIAAWYAHDLDAALDQVVREGGCWIDGEQDATG